MIAARVELDHPGISVEDALEIPVNTNRPVDRAGPDAQHLLQLFHQSKRILGCAVHFIDKRKDRNIPHAADFEELNGLCLNALCGVNEHHCRVCGHKNTVGVFGEVLVSGCIQNIDPESVKIKLHGGRSH